MSFRNWLADFLEALGGAAQKELDASSENATGDEELFVGHHEGTRLDKLEPHFEPHGIDIADPPPHLRD
ncbi:MAG: hypothetical protein ACMZ66_00440 [Thalassospira sp.]|uniref:hypothetical protein n=1 Tax=Thalassospira sp. TaxID=1912094 RepID=UPI003A84EB1A